MSTISKITIEIAADIAKLQREMQSAKHTVSGAVDTMNKVLGTIGVSISVAGLAGFVKQSINAADSALELSQKIGVAVEDLAGLELAFKQSGLESGRLQSSVAKLSKNIAEGSRALDAMGISTRSQDGSLKSTRELLGQIADRFARYQDGAAKTALAQALFGKSGADLIPVLNQGSKGLNDFDAIAAKLGITLDTKTAKEADEFNDTLGYISKGITGVSNKVAAEMLPTLQGLANNFLSSATQGDNLRKIADFLSTALKGLVSVGVGVIGTFQTIGQALGGVAAMWSSIINGDLAGARLIVRDMKKDLSENFKSTIDNITAAWNANASSTTEVAQEAEKLARVQAPLLKNIEGTTQAVDRQTKAFDIEVRKLKEYEKEAARARDITQSVATRQEIYNQKLEELNRLKPYLSVDTYTRALEKAQRELRDTGDVNRSVVSEMDQLWMQAGRNIQSVMANGIFDFFRGGLDDMVRNAGYAVGRIASEFAALRIAQSIGLTAMFAVPGTAAASGGSGGAVSGGASAWDIASLGTSALNLFKGGFGVPGFIGNMGSSLPGAAGSFFTGMAGKGATQLAAEAGAMSLWGASGATTSMAASMGSAFAAAAGPMMAAYMATQLFRGLAGDRRVGGGFGKFINKIGDIPILGDLMPVIPLLNALFGRGPLKQKETTLTGLLGLEGFESGMLQTRFKASGSVFRGSKTDFARIDAITGEIWTDNQKQLGEFAQGLSKAAKEVFGAFNDAAKSASATLNQTAENLGLSTDALRDFSYELNIVSEKGKGLTEEQVGQEIENLTDAMARKLLPQIDDLAKRGETALQAVSRLNSEFTTLAAAGTAFNLTLAESRAAVLGLSYELRTSLIDSLGGEAAVAEATNTFVTGFLSQERQLEIATDSLNDILGKVGLSASMTREEYARLVQTADKTGDVFRTLIDADTMKLFLSVKSAEDQITTARQNSVAASIALIKSMDNTPTFAEIEQKRRDAVTDAFGVLQRSVEADRVKITDAYNKKLTETDRRIGDIVDSVGKLKDLSGALKSAAESIRPMSTLEARSQIGAAIKLATGGNVVSLESVRTSLSILAKNDESNFSTGIEFARSQAQNLSLLNELEKLTDDQLSIEERSLDELKDTRKLIEDGFSDEMSRLDSVLESYKLQLDAMNGINTSVLSVADAINNLQIRINEAGPFTMNPSGVVSIPSGLGGPDGIDTTVSRVSDQDIIDYFSVARTDAELAADALANGISSNRIASVMGFSQSQVDQFFRDNPDIPKFDTGINYVPFDMPAYLHRGEEVRSKEYVDKDREERNRLIDLLEAMVAKMDVNNVDTKEMLSIIKSMRTETDDGVALRTKAA